MYQKSEEKFIEEILNKKTALTNEDIYKSIEILKKYKNNNDKNLVYLTEKIVEYLVYLLTEFQDIHKYYEKAWEKHFKIYMIKTKLRYRGYKVDKKQDGKMADYFSDKQANVDQYIERIKKLLYESSILFEFYLDKSKNEILKRIIKYFAKDYRHNEICKSLKNLKKEIL